jgi:site-specific recombinase XerD
MYFHNLRSVSAAIVLVLGIRTKLVQELLGHGSFLITMNLDDGLSTATVLVR